MPIRLDEVRALAPRPTRPRVWLWLVILVLLLLLGVAAQLLFTVQTLAAPRRFWGPALVAPLALWSALVLLRITLFVGQQRVADGWDEARQSDLIQRINCGRRSQQILSVSLHTALKGPETFSDAQLDAMLKAQVAVRSQLSRQGAKDRHSRLTGDLNEAAERLLARMFTEVLADLAPTLTQLPSERPLELMLAVETCVSEKNLRTAWSQAWGGSGIRQSVAPVNGDGLAVVDQWLDQRVSDHALLMVVAIQVAPSQPEGTTEAAVGLLLGNRSTQNVLPPLAYLHRPEQERRKAAKDLVRASHQALEWGPLEAGSIRQVWRSGVDRQRDGAIASALSEVFPELNEDQGLCDLDVLLGHAGPVSPWLAIAAAALNVQRGAEPQFIFAGGSSVDAGLWGMALTPASAPSK